MNRRRARDVFQLIVNFIDAPERRGKFKPGHQRLQPQMILLIDHDGDGFIGQRHRRPASIVARRFVLSFLRRAARDHTSRVLF